MKRNPFRNSLNNGCLFNPGGSVTVIVALSMSVLVLLLVIVVETGFLYSEKNRYQNAVEAAAMAGALRLCSGDVETVAYDIAIDNILPDEDSIETEPNGNNGIVFYDQEGNVYRLSCQTGFYDEKDEYPAFETYDDFAPEGSGSFPPDEYNNAVMVVLGSESAGLTGMMPLPENETTTTVKAAAVAYLKCYGMLSLNEGDGAGIVFKGFEEDALHIQNGDIHANGDVYFEKEPDVANAATVSASGTVSGYNGSGGAELISSVKPVSLDNLREQADEIITADDFPISGTREDNDNNEYGRGLIFSKKDGVFKMLTFPCFYPHKGTHGGKIYYFENNEKGGIVLSGPPADNDEPITNLTIVSEGNVYWTAKTSYVWGGDNEDQMVIITGENIEFGGGEQNIQNTDSYFKSEGVIFRVAGDVNWVVSGVNIPPNYKLRIITDGNIEFQYKIDASQTYEPNLNHKFGPPCPPYEVRLGHLTATP